MLVKRLWLNSEQTAEKVVKKLFMEIWVQILPGLETNKYNRLRRFTANAGDFTG